MENLLSLKKYFIRYKWYYVLGILFVTLSSVFSNYQAIVVRKATNEIVYEINQQHFNQDKFFVFLLYLIGLSVLSGVFMFLMRQTIIVSSRHIEYEQKNELYEHFQKMDKQFLKMQSVGDLMNKIGEDVGRVRMFTGPAVMYLVNVIVTLISVISFMLHVSPLLTVAVLLPLPVFSFLIFRLSKKINFLSTHVQEQLSVITSFVQESISSIRLIKIHSKERFFEEKLKNNNDNYSHQFVLLGKTEALFQPLMTMMVGTGIIVTVWLGSILLAQNKIEPGNITEFVIYVYRLTWPFTALGWVSALIQRASASQKRINELLNTQPKIINTNYDTYKIDGHIRFDNVSFEYEESKMMALKNVSFEVVKGEVLGITGKVGSGKSTIFQLLLRFYDVNRGGQILIDNKDIQKHNLYWLRRHMAYVSQDAFLFNDTVLNNIIFPDRETDMQRVIDICIKVEIHDTIMSWPDQYNTMIGEKGINVSGGQRQRIALARALLKNAPILLIDDAFSALDNETEQKIIQNIKEELKNKTVIIIAQKLSVLQSLADKIMYLKEGVVTECGTPYELLKMNGEYRKIYDIQMTKTIIQYL
ncbi:MAG: ABC transporter ATP-binding protein/permease [Bacteroidia bacterium]|nr:ABC transporter ATP-binding protein/permease [Bacteroidia bacterium]